MGEGVVALYPSLTFLVSAVTPRNILKPTYATPRSVDNLQKDRQAAGWIFTPSPTLLQTRGSRRTGTLRTTHRK